MESTQGVVASAYKYLGLYRKYTANFQVLIILTDQINDKRQFERLLFHTICLSLVINVIKKLSK